MKSICLLLTTLCLSLNGYESTLKVSSEKGPHECYLETSDFDEIAETLQSIGVQFEKWEAEAPLSSDASNDEILEAYSADIARIMQKGGFVAVDVISLKPDHPKKEELRHKFLHEHRHTDDEVRFFVDGTGIFYLHIEDKVYAIQCVKGDLIGVPANTAHWFDMTEEPHFTAIRFFKADEGWVAHETGDSIADRFI